jgi:hypothetical protein
MKKVHFNEHVVVHIIPREDRAGHWVIDAHRFKDRISKLERNIERLGLYRNKLK